jgi:hypothetical protein
VNCAEVIKLSFARQRPAPHAHMVHHRRMTQMFEPNAEIG